MFIMFIHIYLGIFTSHNLKMVALIGIDSRLYKHV